MCNKSNKDSTKNLKRELSLQRRQIVYNSEQQNYGTAKVDSETMYEFEKEDLPKRTVTVIFR